MSFSEFETSLQNGQPVRLYQFQRGPIRWGYTSADRNISHAGIVFRTIEGGITDDGIRQTGDAQADTLTLTLPASTDVAQMYRVVAPAQTVQVTIFDLHYGDNGYLVVWIGNVAGVKFTDQITAKVQCQTLETTLERTGLRKTWMRGCSNTLYDNACRAPRNNFKTEGVITHMDGISIGFAAASGQPNGYYAGGYVEWTSQYGLEQRGIEAHVGDTLTLFGSTFGLINGQNIAVFAGCDRTMNTCNNRFNNLINYGGCPFMPDQSPFDGNQVF